jgi:drug/metabolite transporter (DMT)-like permease
MIRNGSANGSRFRASDAWMLFATFLWGINFILVKISLRELSPAGFNGLRILFSALVLVALVAVSGKGFGVTRGDLWKLVLIGFAGNAVYQVLFIKAMSSTTASNTSLILSMSPIYVALLSAVFRIERIPWAGWLGIVISFLGLYFVIAEQHGGPTFSAQSASGDLAIFFGTMLWAVYTVFSNIFLKRMTPLQFSAVTFSAGTLFYVPYTAGDILRIPWASVSWAAWLCLALSGLFGLVIGYLVWYNSVREVGNAKTAIYSNLTPVFTFVFAAIWLGERLHAFMLVGAAIILGGVYLTRSGYRFFERRVERGEISEGPAGSGPA